MLFSMGTTPVEVIRRALDDQCPTGYHMEVVGQEFEALQRVVNQGIDAYLEGVTHSNFVVKEDKLPDGRVIRRYLDCEVSNKDMLILMRRLNEDGGDDAMSLRSAILISLELEEV